MNPGFPAPYRNPPKPSEVFSPPTINMPTRAAHAHIEGDATDKHGRDYKSTELAFPGAKAHFTKDVERMLRDECAAKGLDEDGIVIQSKHELALDIL